MFIELSDGTIIDTSRVWFTFLSGLHNEKPYVIVCGDTASAMCSKEDHDKIKAVLFDNDQHKGVFREKVRSVIAEDLR